MKNKIFLLLLFTSVLFADSYSNLGDKEFDKKNYKQAIDNYLKSKNPDKKYLKLKLINSYLQLGDNFFKIRNYKVSLYWYQEATKIDSDIALTQISKVYEKQANEFERAHKYSQALEFYKKSLLVRDDKLKKKIQEITNLLEHQKKLDTDTRKLVTNISPTWTHSVGKLIISTKLKFINEKKYTMKNQNCSATLVNLHNNANSNIIITASHCLSLFDPEAGYIKFIIKDSSNNMIFRIANIEFDSKFNIKKLNETTDFAILSLQRPISIKEVKPMIITKDSFLTLQKNSIKRFGSLAGFSSDIAKYGSNLTYDPLCELKKYTERFGASTCKGFNGASGGPIVLTTTNNNINFQYYFVGVVSHFKNKDFTNIYFAPHHLFYKKIKDIIESNQF